MADLSQMVRFENVHVRLMKEEKKKMFFGKEKEKEKRQSRQSPPCDGRY